MEANARHNFSFGGKTQKKEGYTVAVFELLASHRALKATTAVLSFALFEIDLPQIGSLEWVVSLESDPRRLIDKT